MNIRINVADNFEALCDDCDAASRFRRDYLSERYLSSFERIEFELAGVDSMSQPFVEALFGSLAGPTNVAVLRTLQFHNYRSSVRELIDQALKIISTAST